MKIQGSGGSKGHTPVEVNDTAASNTIGRIIDLICEGPIEGPANDDNWYKSTYYNETPVMDESGNYNSDQGPFSSLEY